MPSGENTIMLIHARVTLERRQLSPRCHVPEPDVPVTLPPAAYGQDLAVGENATATHYRRQPGEDRHGALRTSGPRAGSVLSAKLPEARSLPSRRVDDVMITRLVCALEAWRGHHFLAEPPEVAPLEAAQILLPRPGPLRFQQCPRRSGSHHSQPAGPGSSARHRGAGGGLAALPARRGAARRRAGPGSPRSAPDRHHGQDHRRDRGRPQQAAPVRRPLPPQLRIRHVRRRPTARSNTRS